MPADSPTSRCWRPPGRISALEGVDGDAIVRDHLVLRMAVLGYAPHLVADAVSGRIPVAALEHAIRLRLLGRTEIEIAWYLEEQAEQANPHAAATVAPRSATIRTARGRREEFVPAVLRAAARHRVDADLLQAVIRHESDCNPTARSRKGALGLMQLMPDTARLLGVDPLDPEQNIDGWTR